MKSQRMSSRSSEYNPEMHSTVWLFSETTSISVPLRMNFSKMRHASSQTNENALRVPATNVSMRSCQQKLSHQLRQFRRPKTPMPRQIGDRFSHSHRAMQASSPSRKTRLVAFRQGRSRHCRPQTAMIIDGDAIERDNSGSVSITRDTSFSLRETSFSRRESSRSRSRPRSVPRRESVRVRVGGLASPLAGARSEPMLRPCPPPAPLSAAAALAGIGSLPRAIIDDIENSRSRLGRGRESWENDANRVRDILLREAAVVGQFSGDRSLLLERGPLICSEPRLKRDMRLVAPPSRRLRDFEPRFDNVLRALLDMRLNVETFECVRDAVLYRMVFHRANVSAAIMLYTAWRAFSNKSFGKRLMTLSSSCAGSSGC